jgi:hypothetical protein
MRSLLRHAVPEQPEGQGGRAAVRRVAEFAAGPSGDERECPPAEARTQGHDPITAEDGGPAIVHLPLTGVGL